MTSALKQPNEEDRRHRDASPNVIREFWLHAPSGYVWALEIDSAGRVIGAAGPLTKRDADPLILDYFLYKATDVPWIVRDRLQFTRLPEGG